MACPIQRLLSLPPGMAREFETLEAKPRPAWFTTSDPAGHKLGSGGGTAHLLAEAWRQTGAGRSFVDWLATSRKLLIHGGGQSRRLPSYAPVGKLLLPVPVFRWSYGQRLDQTLLEVQLPDYERVLAHAGPRTAAMITSGDVLLRFARELPPFPDVDVLGLGMWVTPEKARDFGVFFSPRARPTELAFFLQKPEPATIRSHAGQFFHLVDTGMWLLSERAVRVLMAKCGWQEAGQQFTGATASQYELYAQFGLSLGSQPQVPDPEIASLTSAVLPLPEAEFYHFGTSRQLIESVAALQNLELDETKLGLVGAKRHPDQFVQNAQFDYPLKLEENHTLWIENSAVPATWRLAHEHVFTGVPANAWDLRLEPGVCLDFVPVGETEVCLRAYGFEDTFNGALSHAGTQWFGRPAAQWFAARGMAPTNAGEGDIQLAKLFPVSRRTPSIPGSSNGCLPRSPSPIPSLRSAGSARAGFRRRILASRPICAGFTSSATTAAGPASNRCCAMAAGASFTGSICSRPPAILPKPANRCRRPICTTTMSRCISCMTKCFAPRCSGNGRTQTGRHTRQRRLRCCGR